MSIFRKYLPAKAWLIAILVIIGFCLALVFYPLPSALQHNDYSRVLFSSDGALLGAKISRDHQWRFSQVEQLPEKYRQSLLTFEDKNFYRHPGLDPSAIARALLSNVKTGHIVSGGSTISMQLARMLRQESLAQAPPRNLASKIIEAFITLQLEWHFSKSEILRDYANHAPFGGNIIGLHAASWRYFGRAPEQLSWAESALLAVLPNSPAMMHLGLQRELLQKKRDRLLCKLHRNQLINDLDLQLALLEPLPEKPQSLPQLAPHLLARLIKEHPQQPLLYSTINRNLQKQVNDIARRHSTRLASEGINNLAILVIDNETLQTRAYIGNEAWQDAVQYSPDVDIINRPRSTGSILKPLLYASMLQEGELLPGTLVPDIPTQFGSFTPQNFDRQFRGAVPAQQALAQSLNIPAVHMLKQFGVNRFQEQLKSLGMSTLFRPADDYGLTLILGGAEGTLWEISSIYAQMIATTRSGSLARLPENIALLQNEAEQERKRLPIIRQGAAWLTLEAMIEVARPGNDSFWREYQNSQTIAWKTGTSYGLRDAWSIGSNSRYTVGVWAGNAGGEPAPALTGSSSAAPVMFDVFDLLGASNWLAKPSHALKKVSVCADDGYLAGGQCAEVEQDIPEDSHFAVVTPFHKRIHLDGKKMQRVHSGCESVNSMRSLDWFVLPAAQEYFWRQRHSNYQPMPQWRPDCIAQLAEVDDDQPMDLLYPHASSRIYLPLDLNGLRTRALLRAVHRNNQAKIFWHLDDNYLGESKVFHEQTVALEPGMHKLLLLDEQGYKLERWFKVLGDENKDEH
ncbi:MAG TPA: penicillin-binding protein 1C [Cellvibrio sp.]|nr:penicillin-binding protein 1C [Cellvibrio sp.]